LRGVRGGGSFGAEVAVFPRCDFGGQCEGIGFLLQEEPFAFWEEASQLREFKGFDVVVRTLRRRMLIADDPLHNKTYHLCRHLTRVTSFKAHIKHSIYKSINQSKIHLA
jgi:hypothetical protein